MRRTISILLVIQGLSLLFTGIRNIPLPCFKTFAEMFDPFHAISAGIFTVLLIIHVWLNRKPLLRYFRNLGWWWILVGLGFLSIIWGGIVITVLVALGNFG